jgi:hypothetical protein
MHTPSDVPLDLNALYYFAGVVDDVNGPTSLFIHVLG